MAESEQAPEREPDPEPIADEAEAPKRVERRQDTGGAIDVDAAHERSS